MKLYGKAPLTELLTSTAAENRLPHAILLTGESGSGRRTIAKYIAKLFMCGAPPCGGCAACNKIDQDSHPDVIYVLDKCGGTYNIKQVREYVCDNTAVKPNDGDIKVYIFEKADTLRPDAQNALLKNIEEPQPWVKFIFICESSASLLTTIRSRVTEYSMPECPEEECAKCLAEQYGVDKKAALDNARMMNGNIGRCLEALNGGDELKLMESAKRVATRNSKAQRISAVYRPGRTDRAQGVLSGAGVPCGYHQRRGISARRRRAVPRRQERGKDNSRRV